MRALFAFAVELGLIDRNPFKQVKLMPDYRKPPKTIDIEIIKQAIDACWSVPCGWFWQIVIQILYATGIRRRQLVEIRWEDVDLENKVLVLRAEGSKTRRENKLPLNGATMRGILTIRQKQPNVQQDEQVFNICRFNGRFRGERMCED